MMGQGLRDVLVMRTNPDHVLLRGPYRAPALKLGRAALCLIRGEVVVTGWSEGRIPWPLCHPAGRGGRSAFLVNRTLARAVRTESAVALGHWFGVDVGTVTRWRKALGVGRLTEGSARLRRKLNRALGAAKRGVPLSADVRQRMSEAARAQGRRPPRPYPDWRPEELGLLATLTDEEVAARTGRPVGGVRAKRRSVERARRQG
jgi:hypothetical protein